ncbi:hypothetical protein AN217_25865 [Streptomyces qinglanensis]|uniref:OmpR/PhoB-type domain-containing protein n=1 Tax=Streptomyces qinglanensis TaxID=943816 RepID=A0A1E7K9P3_9ACTN|nr:BTAD domain-containing putative transcriptional regulator [Streptomyces qinglanensis]OEV00655.1 hypothetical protein AN217_25865 [Streptomyces qinglanensis]OEV24744.1 hypothetical protein AN220_17510 [Streptomyces nanshensis]
MRGSGEIRDRSPDGLRFGLLGTVCLFDQVTGEPCPVGGTMVRTLLAALLREPGRVVTAEALQDALWDSPPPSARASLQNFAARLRRVLDDPGRLRGLRTGYRLVVQDGELDVRVFRRGVVAARAAAAAGRWSEVSERTRAALALWRGAPLTGVRTEFVDLAYADRLQEERLELLEWRMEARLALREDPAEFVPELTGLAAGHPLREAFHRQLMLALHRSDRQAEALEVHRVLRRTLAERLGTEPGPAVQAAHREVLAVPAAPRGKGRGAARLAPATTPPAPSCFTGREAERAALRSALGGTADGGPRVAVVSGMPGVGKSALAAQAAYDLRSVFPGGQLHVHLHGAAADGSRRTPQQAIAVLLRDLGVAPQDVPGDEEAAAALLRTVLACERILLVLDDAACAAQVRPLLPAGAGCGVLITSRSGLTALDRVRHVALRPLTARESAALLRTASGRDDGIGAGHQLVALAGGLPLALRVMAARLAARSTLTADRLALLLDGDGLLEGLEYDDLSVRRLLTGAVRALRESERGVDRDAALVLDCVGSVPLPDYGEPLLARLAGLPAGRTAAALERLTQAALLEEPAPERYTAHDLVREAAAGCPASADRLSTALNWYAEGTGRLLCTLVPPGAERRDRLYVPEGDGAGTFPDGIVGWAEAELPNIVVLADCVAGAADVRAADGAALAGVVRQLFPFLQRYGRINELDELARHALTAACAVGDAHAISIALSDLAGSHFLAGRLNQALEFTGRALRLQRASGDRVGIRRSLSHQGLLLDRLGRDADAQDALHEALGVAHDLADTVAQSHVLSHLGNLADHRGDPTGAVTFHERSLALGERNGDAVVRHTAYCNIGYALLRSDEPEQALLRFQRGLAVLRDFPDWHSETQTRLGLVRGLRAMGDARRALDEATRLAELASKRHDRHAEGLAHYERGHVLAVTGRAQQAREQWGAALEALSGTDSAEVPELRELLGMLPEPTEPD